MKFPDFYNNIKKIKMFDPLANVLGSCDEGLLEYSFGDIVKYTGHGCPTVAGAYMVCATALAKLYPDGQVPVRGGVEVFLHNKEDDGANGVIGNVFTFILGASGIGGFKGLAGQFSRNNLIHYGVQQKTQYCFKRKDNGKSVFVDYHPEFVSGDPRTSMLLGKILKNEVTAEETRLMHDLWNKRVEKLLVDEANNPEIYLCTQI